VESEMTGEARRLQAASHRPQRVLVLPLDVTLGGLGRQGGEEQPGADLASCGARDGRVNLPVADDLIEEIDQRRGELQFAAISMGERIYDEKPKRFAKRLERRWEAWREREPVAA